MSFRVKSKRSVHDPSEIAPKGETALGFHVEVPDRQIQQLWFTLARKPWSSIAIVPVDAAVAADRIAKALAAVPKWLREDGVTLLTMSNPLDYVAATEMVVHGLLREGTRTIVAVQPVLVEPLGLGVTQKADTIVLCVKKGCSRTSSVRRTIELVGRERITGCVLVR